MGNGVSRATWDKAEDTDTKLNILFDEINYIKTVLAPKRMVITGLIGGVVAVVLLGSPKVLSVVSMAVAGMP